MASLVAQRVKRLPPMQETRVRFLGREDPLEKEMAIHSSILAWTIPWTEKPSRLQSTGVAKSQTRLSDFTFTSNNLQKIIQTSVSSPDEPLLEKDHEHIHCHQFNNKFLGADISRRKCSFWMMFLKMRRHVDWGHCLSLNWETMNRSGV